MRVDAITAYTLNTEILCPPCLTETGITCGWLAPGARGMAIEDALDQAAEYLGVDRVDEAGYDSQHFPKIVFAGQLADTDRCDHCHQPLT